MNKRLLIVDDEKNIINALNRLFWDAEFEIIFANEAVKALDIINETDIQVLISDHKMPGMTGVELIASIKQSRPDIVCMMLTGYSDVANISTSLKELLHKGVYKLLPKPWNDLELRKSVADAFEYYDISKEAQSKLSELNHKNEELTAQLQEQQQTILFSQQALGISQKILDCLPTPILCLDTQGIIVLANQNACRLLSKDNILVMLHYQDVLKGALLDTVETYLNDATSEHLFHPLRINQDSYLLTCTTLNDGKAALGYVLALQKHMQFFDES